MLWVTIHRSVSGHIATRSNAKLVLRFRSKKMKLLVIVIGLLCWGCLGGASHLRVKHSVDLNAAIGQVHELPLPRVVSVDGYHIELQPFVEEGKYKGRVKMNVTVNDETSSITVHAHPNLRIVSKPAQEISVREILEDQLTLANKSIQVTGTQRDQEKHWFIINLAETLKRTASYQIELRFSGDLEQENNIGFFRKRFTDKVTEEKRWYAATKMSPTNARNVFPCFDEPMLKAPFELSVARLAHMKAISVMPIRATENMTNEAGWMWDHFHRTPPMSTFSFGMLVTDLPKLKTSTIINNKEQVVMNVYGREELREQLESTAQLAPKLIEFFQKYLDLPFPLPELHIVALPSYDDTEAADHWGLVMFKERSLVEGAALWKLTSEISSQWIGHLITPHWWSDLRVATGLSNYLGVTAVLGAVCTQAWHPSSGYSIYYEFSKPHPFAGIPTMKQTIHAHSTQWLFRMLNYTLGEATFQQGIQTFARERQFLTFSEDDVWKGLTEEAHTDKVLDESMQVETITRGWMNEDRFPVVSVKRDYQSSTASVKQHVFLRARPHDIGDKNSLTWWIPIMYLTSENVTLGSLKTTGWMKSEKEITIKDLPDKNEFIIMNPVEIGMFIVNYDERNWQLISEYLVKSSRGDAPKLDSDVRTKLLHDAWNLAYSGELSFATALNMTLFLEFERDFVVWETMFTMIDHVGRDICHTDAGKKFLEYSQQLMIPMYESLGEETENEPDSTKKLKSMTKYFLCNGNYLPCIKQAKEVYSNWMQMPDPEIGNPVPDNEMCLVFKWGTMEEWKFGLQRVINFPSNRKQQERSNMIRSLAGCPRQSEKVEYFLNVTVLDSNSTFSDSDTQLGINMLSGDALGYSTLFEFLVENWDAIKARYENSPYMWEYVVSKAVGSFKTQEGLNKVSKLYAERKGQFLSAESIVIEKLKKAIEETKWTNEALPVIDDWLNKRKSAQ